MPIINTDYKNTELLDQELTAEEQSEVTGGFGLGTYFCYLVAFSTFERHLSLFMISGFNCLHTLYPKRRTHRYQCNFRLSNAQKIISLADI